MFVFMEQFLLTTGNQLIMIIEQKRMKESGGIKKREEVKEPLSIG